MNKIIETKISVGVDHPLYNKVVRCEVLADNTGFDGRQTYVRTVDEVVFDNLKALRFDKKGRFVKYELLPPRYEKVEAFALKD